MRLSHGEDQVATLGAGGNRNAELLFRTKPISEIRNVESTTNKQIQDKKEELRQLVGTRYRDLIDSADSILQMKSACESISSNISSIHQHIRSLSASPISEAPKLQSSDPVRVHTYGIACRVKYIVDTPENIWGCLDESMFLEAASRYIRAKYVHSRLMLMNAEFNQRKILSNFPLLQHQWQIVESFKVQISQRARERLLDRGLGIGAYADALAAVAVIDDLEPKQVLGLLIDTKKTWIMQSLSTFSGNATSSEVVSIFCDVLSIIEISVGHVGELFLLVLNDMPLFYKVILYSPPASQLFGGISNPDEEVRLWKSYRDKLDSTMVVLDKEYIAKTCLSWLKDCGNQIVSKINGGYLIDAIGSGKELGSAEKLIRETMDSKEVLVGSLEWLKSVFGSEIELPWSRIRELVLGDNSDLWDEIFEDAFLNRMKYIINSGFDDLARVLNLSGSVSSIKVTAGEKQDFQSYLNRPSTGGAVWFIEANNFKKSGPVVGHKALPEENDLQSCLNAYFGDEVSRIRDAVDNCFKRILEDLLSFLESPKASLRLKELAPYLQHKSYDSISSIVRELKIELDSLFAAMENHQKEGQSAPPATLVERSLFIGRLLFAFKNHSKHIPVILGSPRFWENDTLAAVFDRLPSLMRRASLDSPVSEGSGKQTPSSSRRQTSSATAALLNSREGASPKLDELNIITRDLCIKAHSLWISWLSEELSVVFSHNLRQDDGLSATTTLRGWEETVLKQEQSDDSQSELKISLPYMPSLYVISFLCRACEEVYRIGGHVLDKSIVQKFALSLLEKVIGIYGDFLSNREAHESQISEKGVLQILLDIRFVADILSGGDLNMNEEVSRTQKTKSPFRRKQEQVQKKSVVGERIDGLIYRLSQKLDPIDWLTYEPYLWENEKQSYLRHAVLFGFFVQLNRMYTDTVQKLPTNSESNILRCSVVPRFKYLPISAPALSSRGATRSSISTASENALSRNSWKTYPNGELSQKVDFDDDSSFGVAAPFLKSFMQVGSRFGESTMKLGSILTDGQVGIFKDRSAAAMSTFGDILPMQAAGLLSSFTATRTDS